MIDLNEKKLYFFDVEVFKYQSCVVFKNLDGETVKIFTNSLDGLGDYIDQGLITEQGFEKLDDYLQGKILVGFNNYGYDDYILYAMSKDLSQEIIKQWNDSIINNTSKVGMQKIKSCITLDVFQQIDVSMPSLKKIEGNLGKSIVESKVDFNIDRKLTPEENLETIKYCEYDVLQTIEIYKMRSEYFETKNTIVKMIENRHLHDKAYKWNTTSVIGQILAPKKSVKKNSRFVDDEMLELVPVDVKNMWLELDRTFDYKFKTRKTVINELENIIEFGWGGLHGAPDGVVEVRNVKLLDVTSMYPSILINFNGLGDNTNLYERMKLDRIQLKSSGDNPELDKAYKLILNSTYGLLNNQYSQLNNPMLAFSICIYGQISLYVLSQMLHNVGCRVFNINTDGVAFEPDLNSNYKKVVPEWEQLFSLELEEESYKYWIQKDVNNYIAVADDGYINTKGGDTNNYRDYENGGRNYYFSNSNTRIVQKALVEKIVKNVSIADTVMKNKDDVILYQYILQAGRTYKGTFDNQGNKLQNVNRVFAGKNTAYEIFKKRVDGGLVKFADAPSDMILFNGDLKDFDKEIDLQWYYDLAIKNYDRWRV